MYGTAERQQQATGESASSGARTWRVLAVDDQQEVLTSLQRLLRRRGFDLECHTSPHSALTALETDSGRYDMVLLDVNMPEMSGLELLARSRRVDVTLPIIMLTADNSAEMASKALKSGVFSYLSKPLDSPDMVALTLARAGHHGRLQRRTRELEMRVTASERFQTLVGATAVMRAVVSTIGKLAESDVNVLLRGAPGTGKALCARAIHDHSSRREGPFVALRCGDIPAAMVDSELFGLARGALIEADGGTLFLGEVRELSLPAQLRLLRVLQKQELQRPDGGARCIDVRLISSDQGDLEEAVSAKEFSLDLFCRLNVVNMSLPPLRERLEDVPLLAAHLLDKHLSRLERTAQPRLTVRAMEALCSYDWPGNVRELESALQRALAMSPGDQIDLPAFPRRVTGGLATLRNGTLGVTAGGLTSVPPAPPVAADLGWADEYGFTEAKRLALRDFESAYLTRLLARTDGNISEAARIAGIDRSNLKRVLTRLGLREGTAKRDPGQPERSAGSRDS